MKFVTVIFTRRHNIGSIALRWWMHSRFSHCGILTSEDSVIEAVSSGVREIPKDEFLRHYSYYETINIPCEEPDKVISMARTVIGKPYDWLGILGFRFRCRLQSDNAFLCSELIAWAFEKSGFPLFRRASWRINPEMLYLPRYDISSQRLNN